MASTINSTTTAPGGLVTTGDASNQLELQTGDTTRLTIDSSGNATFTGDVSVNGTLSGTLSATGSFVVNGTSASGADIKLYEDTDNGTNYVAFQAPSSIASNITWTLPNADGTNGQVLSTNGSGTLSWASGGGGGSSISAGDSSVVVTDTGTGKVEITVDSVEVADFTTGAIVFNETGANQDFRVEGDTNANLFFIDASTDRIGIGTSTPVSLLELKAGLPILTFTDDNDSSATRLYEDSGLFAIDVDPTDTKPLSYLQLKIDGVEKARLNSNALLVGTTNTTANGGVLQVSNGITFPATQVTCSDVNTLDDYEEGTWTPTDASGAGLTLTISGTPSYVKIGSICTVTAFVTYPSTANASAASIGSLPFTIKNIGSSQAAVIANTNRGVAITAVGVANDTRIVFTDFSDVNQTNANFSTKFVRFSFTYITS